MPQRRQTRIILALDVDRLSKAQCYVRRLYPKIRIFKVGIHLFTAYGPRIVEEIRAKGAGVFLDLKFFDIPNTVAHALRQAVRLRVAMITLHIMGGRQMLKAAVQAAKEEARAAKIKKPLLLGVTVLTSKATASSSVLSLAREAIECGLDGVVCSVREAKLLRQRIKKEFIIVTPGIRLKGSSGDDQKRTATPEEAKAAGSDYLVIGRPVLNAKNPLQVVKQLLEKN